MKRWLLTMIAAWLAVSPAWGQEVEVDRAEVLRLGDMVQHVDGVGSDPEALFVEAMGPPASDADKWFISVLDDAGMRSLREAQGRLGEQLLAIGTGRSQ